MVNRVRGKRQAAVEARDRDQIAADKAAFERRRLAAIQHARLAALLESAPSFELRPAFKSWFEHTLRLPVSRVYSTVDMGEPRGLPRRVDRSPEVMNDGNRCYRHLGQ